MIHYHRGRHVAFSAPCARRLSESVRSLSTVSVGSVLQVHLNYRKQLKEPTVAYPAVTVLLQWRAFQKAVGDYNCTLVPDTVGSNNSSTLPAKPINSSRGSDHPTNDTAAPLAKKDDHPRHLLDMAGFAATGLADMHTIRVPYAGQRRQLLQAVEAAPPGQHYVCDKLGQGVNARHPQNLNQRVIRFWKDSKKNYLPEDAAAAASAGAVAGIVLGTTLGAGLTALIGYVAYKQYQKRRIKRLYNLGVSNTDMMMVHREVETQWLTTGGDRRNRDAPV